MTTDTQQIQRSLDELENEIRLMRVIIFALYERASEEDQEAIFERFQGVVGEMKKTAPDDIDSEVVIDLLARAQIYLSALRAKFGSK